MKIQMKSGIISYLKENIRRINIKYKRMTIVVAGDLNIKAEEIRKLSADLKLFPNNTNYRIITSEQGNSTSTLDYFLATSKINKIQVLKTKSNSDHYPLIANIRIKNAMKRKWKYRWIETINRNIEENDIGNLTSSEWSLTNKLNCQLITKRKRTIRPKVFLKNEKIDVFNDDMKLKEKVNMLKEIDKKAYKDFMKQIDTQRDQAPKYFSKI